MLKFYFQNLTTEKVVKLKYKHLTQEGRYQIFVEIEELLVYFDKDLYNFLQKINNE